MFLWPSLGDYVTKKGTTAKTANDSKYTNQIERHMKDCLLKDDCNKKISLNWYSNIHNGLQPIISSCRQL